MNRSAFSPIARQLVDTVMRDHCERRQWQLLALAVRSNHVHVVVGQPDPPPELLVQQLKVWATRRFLRLCGKMDLRGLGMVSSRMSQIEEEP